jgi:hypothetical protein
VKEEYRVKSKIKKQSVKGQEYRLKFKNWIDDVGWVFIVYNCRLRTDATPAGIPCVYGVSW